MYKKLGITSRMKITSAYEQSCAQPVLSSWKRTIGADRLCTRCIVAAATTIKSSAYALSFTSFGWCLLNTPSYIRFHRRGPKTEPCGTYCLSDNPPASWIAISNRFLTMLTCTFNRVKYTQRSI